MSTDRSEETKVQTAKIFKLDEMLQYQNISVVSQTVIEKKTGTVTMFAFDEGQGLSEHTTPYDAMVYVLDGTVDISISGKSHILNMGDMINMPATEPHALKAVKKFKMLLVMIKS